MLQKLLNINGLQKLNKSEQKFIQGSGSCKTNFACEGDFACPGYEYGGSACIQGFCHFF